MSTVEMDPAATREAAQHLDTAATALDENESATGVPGAVRQRAAERLAHLDQLEAQQRARSVVRCADLASALRNAAAQAVRVDAAVR